MTFYVPEWQLHRNFGEGNPKNASLWAQHERTCLLREAESAGTPARAPHTAQRANRSEAI